MLNQKSHYKCEIKHFKVHKTWPSHKTVKALGETAIVPMHNAGPIGCMICVVSRDSPQVVKGFPRPFTPN